MHFFRRQALRAFARAVETIHGADLRRVFDQNFYLERYPDVARAGVDPLGHFLRDGARERRQPHPLFDTEYYLATSPDVAASGMNPLLHYLRYGWKEHRRPNIAFDPDWYRAQHPELPAGTNPFLDFLRRRDADEKVAGAPTLTTFLQGGGASPGGESAPHRVVDIIVPVYRGLELTRACLESIRAAQCRTPFETIVVNDASPEPDLAAYVRHAAALHGFTLIENQQNLGFAGCVNRALARDPDRDVVLLNSDTEVANDWLDRLAAAAYSEPRIGTVTPFSNNATICGYPWPGNNNEPPAGATVAETDSIFRHVNAGRTIDLPTGVGFCMYLRRACLTDTGPLDEREFPQGYGEESDYCLRASARGWRHLLAADVFVYHAGEISFGAEAAALRERAQATLRRLHPQWDALLARYGRSDPAAFCRFLVSARRLRDSGRPVILAVGHALGGGTAQHVAELARHLHGRAELIVLAPCAGGTVILEAPNPDYGFRIAVDTVTDYEALLQAAHLCGVSRMHLHHLHGYAPGMLERLARDLRLPFDFTVHDYYAICPQVTLTDAAGRYCGEPDAAGCARCIADRPIWPLRDIVAWRREHAWLMDAAERVVAPSQDTAARLRKYYPKTSIIAAAHPDTHAPAPLHPRPLVEGEVLRVAVIGALGLHKGLDRLRACAEQARSGRLPLEFVLIGYVDARPPGSSREPFRQTGEYSQEQLPAILAELRPHLVWFPAQSPETYSFTLSAALSTGVPVVVPDLGAMPERVAGRAWTWIVPWQWDTARLLEFLVSIREANFQRGSAPPISGRLPVARSDFYQSEYLRPLTPVPR